MESHSTFSEKQSQNNRKEKWLVKSATQIKQNINYQHSSALSVVINAIQFKLQIHLSKLSYESHSDPTEFDDALPMDHNFDYNFTWCNCAGASIPLNQWSMLHILHYLAKFINFPLNFILFRFFGLPLIWPWCICALCLTRTGQPCNCALWQWCSRRHQVTV